MKRDACYDTDPSRWFRFLTSITNTTIANKITRSEFLSQNLQQCFEKALRLEASLQLSEGVNMARRTMVMNVNIDMDDEVNLIKDVRTRSNACYKCGEMGHFQRDCVVSMMVINLQMVGKNKMDHLIPMIQWWESG